MSFSRFFFTTINTFTSNDNRSPLSRGFSFICSPVYYFKSSENLYLLLRNCNASRNICRGIDPSSLVVNVSVLEVSDTNPEVPLNPLDFFYFGGGSIFQSLRRGIFDIYSVRDIHTVWDVHMFVFIFTYMCTYLSITDKNNFTLLYV